MKLKLFKICFLALLCSAYSWAQAPQKISYQSVIRNNSNALIVNSAVGMRVSILQGGENGVSVYTETHNPTTNANGLVSIAIGTGTVAQGVFSTIDWSTGSYFVKTEIDPTGGTNYSLIGTSELLSVPFALYAKSSSNSGTSAYIGKFKSDGSSMVNSQIFDDGNNIGVGTNTPAATLHVVRGIGANGSAQFEGNKNHSHFNYNATEDTYIRGGSDGSKVYINDAALTGDVIMSIPTNSNVGIGTNTPTTKLQIDGVSYSSGYLSGYRFDDRVLSQEFNVGNNNNKWEWYSSNGSARLFDHKNGIDRLVIDNNGNIGGLKTKSTGTEVALEIDGSIKVSGNKSAFVLEANGNNMIDYKSYGGIGGNTSVIIDNPICNNDPNAIILATRTGAINGDFVPFTVVYDEISGFWKISINYYLFSKLGVYSFITSGHKWNILIIKQ